MKNIMSAIFVLLAFSSIGMAQKSTSATAQEKKDLFQLISKNDATIVDAIKEGSLTAANLAKDMNVKKVDLNKDGQPEYLVVIQDAYLCGAHGNCTNRVYRKSGNQYQEVLVGSGEMLTLEKTSSNKFRDLRLEGSNTAFEGSGTVFKFDGHTYKASECYTVTSDGNGKKGKMKKTVVKCEEGN